MIWRQNVQNFSVRSQNYKSNQITMERIDLTSKQSKMSSYVVKHSKLRKTQNYKSNQIRINLHRFDVKTIKNVEYVANHSKQRKTTKLVKLQWICIDVMSKRSKHLSYVAKHSKQRKTTKLVKLQWIASIWCQNDQNIWVRS